MSSEHPLLATVGFVREKDLTRVRFLVYLQSTIQMYVLKSFINMYCIVLYCITVALSLAFIRLHVEFVKLVFPRVDCFSTPSTKSCVY